MSKILIVEDDVENLNLMKRFLKDRAGLDLVIAEHAEHTFELVPNERPAVILMDLTLDKWDPPADGFDLTEQVRQMPEAENVHIIAVSARAMDHERQKAMDAGCDEFITKPLNYAELIAKLRTLTSN